MASYRFLQRYRLTRRNDFRAVFDQRRSVSDDVLIIYGRANDLPHLRLGMSVAKRLGSAPHRNRLRRLIREAFRLTRPELPGGVDLVIIPRQPDEPTLEMIQDSLRRLVPQLARRLAREAKANDPPAAQPDRAAD
jgi:ribonuclease P protein component